MREVKAMRQRWPEDSIIKEFLSIHLYPARQNGPKKRLKYLPNNTIQKNDIIFVPALYQASDTIFYDTIINAPQKSSCIAIFSHNPGITDFANILTSTRIDNMPTCSVFAVKLDIDHWPQFKQAIKEFYFFDFPKSLQSD